MSIEESAVKARQGGKGRDIFIILVISTVAAALLLWGIYAVFVAGNSNVNSTPVSPGEAQVSDFTAEDTVDVNPNAQAGVPVETDPADTEILQSDEPNPAAPAGGFD